MTLHCGGNLTLCFCTRVRGSLRRAADAPFSASACLRTQKFGEGPQRHTGSIASERPGCPRSSEANTVQRQAKGEKCRPPPAHRGNLRACGGGLLKPGLPQALLRVPRRNLFRHAFAGATPRQDPRVGQGPVPQ